MRFPGRINIIYYHREKQRERNYLTTILIGLLQNFLLFTTSINATNRLVISLYNIEKNDFNRIIFSCIILFAIINLENTRAISIPIIIGHRGASGYLPEHTLPSKALAYSQGVDYLEQDIALSKDNIPIVIHDIYLDEVTNVASVYPTRSRSNGRFYTIDFTAEEIKSLRASERFDHRTGNAIFTQRFPVNKSIFHLNTLAEELEFIAGLNRANIDNRKHVGAYVEIKDPSFHRTQNRSNISEIVLGILAKYNYTKRSDNIFLQCFDIEELQRIRFELKSDLKLIGLLTDNEDRSEYSKTDYTYWTSEIGVQDMATFVDGIGPHHSQLYEFDGTIAPSKLYSSARKYQLFIHPYTFRSDADPQPFSTFTKQLEFFIDELRVEGLFIDQPDKAISYLKTRRVQINQGQILQGNFSVFLSILFFIIVCFL